MAKKVAYVAYTIGALMLFFAALFLIGVLIKCAGFLGERIFPWVRSASDIAFIALIFIFVPLSAVRPLRGFSAASILVISYIFGTLLWLQSFLITHFIWGVAGVATGLFFAGVGIVPLALVAASIHRQWWSVRELLMIAAITILSRLFSIWLAKRSTKRMAPEMDLLESSL